MSIFQAKLMSDLYHLLKQYPHGLKGEGWDIDRLSMNLQLPWQYVREHPEGTYSLVNGELKLVEWNWCYLSRRNDLDWQLVVDLPDKDWDWNYLSRCIKLDWWLVREFPDKDWGHLSRRSDPYWQLVIDLPNNPWSKYSPKLVDINEVLTNLDAYTTSELSSFMFNGQVSGLMTKSARSSGSH